MEYRKLGKSGLKISEISFGAWGISGGWGQRDDDESVRALNRAVDMGVNFFDTAMVYGNGLSEELIRRALKGRNEQVYVATKVSPKNRIWSPPTGTINEVFPKEYIIECTEASLRRLGLECLALQQLHTWTDQWAEADEWQKAAEQLKKQGKILAFGISVDSHAPNSCLEVISTGLIDSVQVIYNIFDQSPEAELFPLAQELAVGIIVRCPLDEGGLTGKIRPETEFAEDDWRSNYFKGDRKEQTYQRVRAIEEWLVGDEVDSIVSGALRFCLSHEAVSTVIPGMRSVVHVEANCAVSEKGPLPAEMVSRLKQHAWDRNFYGKVP